MLCAPSRRPPVLAASCGPARELHVSPGAISRHVKLLEAHLDTRLFERQAHGLKPTDAASALLPEVTAAFAKIAEAAAALPRRAKALAVIASPTFANRLLVPRLSGFAERAPHVTVSVSVLLSDLTEFDADAHDCGIATFHRAGLAGSGARDQRSWPKS